MTMADSFTTTNLFSSGTGTSAKPRVFGVTRSQLMARAWQLARFNKRAATSSLKDGFGRWLSAAWAEAREGNTAFWSVHFSRRDALQAEIDCLGAKDRWSDADYQTMHDLSAELRQVSQ
jgi:hypothetical protein